MKTRVLLIAFSLIFCSLLILFSQVSGVTAVGAPSDNMTIPGFDGGGETQGEIEPIVEYTLLGPSTQSPNALPSVLPVFTGTSGGDGFVITGDETWYLDIDVNAEGWVYIYEYFPEGSAVQGRWITYKWQLPESGVWRFGPFTAGNNEAEGQHIYRIWFYSDGNWAGEDAVGSQGNLVYWTYARQAPVQEPEQITPPPVQPEQNASQNELLEFISRPLVWSLGLLILVLLALGGFFLYRRYKGNGSRGEQQEVAAVEPEKDTGAIASRVTARILLPNDMELKLNGNSRTIGRDDLARALDRDKLILVSRKHFQVRMQDEQFFIEDLGSANGTSLNGADISSSGAVEINNGDVIGLAGTTELKFYIV
jgi:hypothetical protein